MAFPFLQQRDFMQCGIACLAMICKYYGVHISFLELELYCPLSKHGTSLRALSNAAQQLGFSTISGRYTLEQISQMSSPCILHWNQNHFVVLYKIHNKHFYIADPAKGLLTYSLEDFIKHWGYTKSSNNCLGIALALTFNKGDILPKNKCRNSALKKLYSTILKYLSPYNHYFALLGIGLVLNSLLQIIMPLLAQAIVDKGIYHRDLNIIWLILIGELMIVLGKTLSEFIQSWIVVHVSMRMNVSMIYDFFDKLLKLPMSFFESRLIGDLMQRMGDHSRIQSFLCGDIIGIIISIFSFLILSIVLVTYDTTIFVIFCSGSIAYAIWVVIFLSKRKTLDYEFFENQSSNNNVTYQLLANMQEIKLQNCEYRRLHEWVKVQLALFKSQIKLLAMQQIQSSGSLLIHESKNIIITIYAAAGVINGNITLGEMLAIQYIVGQIQAPISRLIQLINAAQDVKISVDRTNEIDLITAENHDRHQTLDNNLSGLSFNLVNVCFKYQTSSKFVLENVSVVIPSGKMTAIVGASGCGKSTLVKLLLGYYTPTKGDIFISGKNINIINTEWIRQHCGVILQDGVIFSESIAQNIAIQEEEINMADVIAAAKVAGIYDFIISLPMGFYTKIGRDGIGLSQGQKQRILIARAVYKSPSVIIMDEATNSLDATTEKVIVENLSDFLKNKTSIVIAHRLSTIKNADQIIVMDNGHIMEIGTHNDLIKKGGHYFQLVKTQLEEF